MGKVSAEADGDDVGDAFGGPMLPSILRLARGGISARLGFPQVVKVRSERRRARI